VPSPLLGEIQTVPALSVRAAFKPWNVTEWNLVALVPNASGVPVAATVLIMLPNVCCAIVLNYGLTLMSIQRSAPTS